MNKSGSDRRPSVLINRESNYEVNEFSLYHEMVDSSSVFLTWEMAFTV